MSQLLHSVHVRGKLHTWCIYSYMEKGTADALRGDDLEVYLIENYIPAWAINAGIPAALWCFIQDVLHFRNPWRK